MQDYNRNIDLNKDVTFLTETSKDVKCIERLNVGDIVKIKNCMHEIEVIITNYKLQSGLMVEYAGKYVNFKMNGFVLFNQKDIEEIISKFNIEKKENIK